MVRELMTLFPSRLRQRCARAVTSALQHGWWSPFQIGNDIIDLPDSSIAHLEMTRGLPRRAVPAVPAPPPRPRAVVVDPDEAFLAFAAEVLNSFRPGFDVATARDVAAAIQWLDTIDPDLLVVGLDVGAEGAEALAQQFHQHAPRRERKILFLGGHDGGDSTSDPAANCQAAVPKPTKLTDLLGLVHTTMNQ